MAERDTCSFWQGVACVLVLLMLQAGLWALEHLLR